jgi:hypothetical protein
VKAGNRNLQNNVKEEEEDSCANAGLVGGALITSNHDSFKKKRNSAAT